MYLGKDVELVNHSYTQSKLKYIYVTLSITRPSTHAGWIYILLRRTEQETV